MFYALLLLAAVGAVGYYYYFVGPQAQKKVGFYSHSLE
jgi:hypothetical protein